MTKEAIRVKPNSDGHCPILAPGEYCQDTIHSVWHFHAPDGQRFAIDNCETRKGAALVLERDGSISFLKGRPTDKASWRNSIVDCKWIVRNGMWVELPDE
jgi:hypothetical protein